MERLTNRFTDGTAFLTNSGVQRFGKQAVVDLLAAYEDTELTPDQIVEMDRLYREKCEEVEKMKGFLLVTENSKLKRENAALEIQIKKLKELKEQLEAKENS